MMASPSSSDHSSPSSAVNTSQDERLPQPGYPPSFLPFTTSSLGNQSYPNKSSSSVQRQGQMAGVVEGGVGSSYSKHAQPSDHQHQQPPLLPYRPAPPVGLPPTSSYALPPHSAQHPPLAPQQTGSVSATAKVTKKQGSKGKTMIAVPTEKARNLPLHITGIPLVGAKSRVETQVKVRIALTLPSSSLPSSHASSSANPLPTPTPSASSSSTEDDFSFITNFTHLKLQKGTATKRKSKKAAASAASKAPVPKQEQMLFLETEVYCATEGAAGAATAKKGGKGMSASTVGKGVEEDDLGLRVYACAGCRTREIKRFQRKAESRVRPTLSDSDLDTPSMVKKDGAEGSSAGGSQDERHKIVLYNCGSLLDFSEGECTLPARITCYCRHHREKTGFVLKLILKDYLGNLVASGITPPILITDDHKSSVAKGPANSSTTESALPSSVPIMTLPKSIIAPSQPQPPPNAKPSRARQRPAKRESSISAGEEAHKKAKPYDRKVSPSGATSLAPTPRALSMTPFSQPTTLSSASATSAQSSQHSSPSTQCSNLSPHTAFNLALHQPQNLPYPYSSGMISPALSTHSEEPSRANSRQMSLAAEGGQETGSRSLFQPNVSPSNQQAYVEQLVQHAEAVAAEGQTKTSVMDVAMDLESELEMMSGSGGGGAVPSFAVGMGASGYGSSSGGESSSHPSYQQLYPQQLTKAEDEGMEGLAFDSLVDYDAFQFPSQQTPSDQQLSNEPFRFDDDDEDISLPAPCEPMTFESLFPASDGFSPNSIPSPRLLDNSPLLPSSSNHRPRTPSDHSSLQQAEPSWSDSNPLLYPPSISSTPRPDPQHTFQFPHNPLQHNIAAPPTSPFAPPKPLITRLIPGEGPMGGGIEVTILGQDFVPGLTCVFGDSPSTSTQFWGTNTLVCLLPPSSCPGPVVVSIRSPNSMAVETDTEEHGRDGLQLFTYLDLSDRALMELALQVVGLKMTGRIEEAKNVAMRIVGQHPSAQGPPPSSSHSGPAGTSRSGPFTESAATGRASTDSLSLPWSTASRGSDFQSTIINFLSLVDVDSSQIPGSASPSLELPDVLSHKNNQGQTLLHLAVILGFHRLTARLISLGADLDSRDRNGYTALGLAALCGRVACTRLLLDAGADQDVVTADGKSPIDLAREKDQVDVEMLLAQRGSPTSFFQSEATGRGDGDSELSASESSIDADNPSSDEEDSSDEDGESASELDGRAIIASSVSSSPEMAALSSGDEDGDRAGSEDDEVDVARTPLRRARAGFNARSKTTTTPAAFSRRRLSIDSQRTEQQPNYSARPEGGDPTSYFSDGATSPHILHQEIFPSPVSDKAALPTPSSSALLTENATSSSHQSTSASPTTTALATQPVQKPNVESWVRRTLSHVAPAIPHLPMAALPRHLSDLAFPAALTISNNIPFLPAQLNPWSRPDAADGGAGVVGGGEGADAPTGPTWAHLTAVYPWLPFAFATWLKEMGPGAVGGVQQQQQQPRGGEKPKEVSVEQQSSDMDKLKLQSALPSSSTTAFSDTKTSSTPIAPSTSSTSIAPLPTKVALRRRTGTSTASKSTTTSLPSEAAAAKKAKAKADRMLWLFWLPIMCLIIFYTVLSHLPMVFFGIKRVAIRALPNATRGLLQN